MNPVTAAKQREKSLGLTVSERHAILALRKESIADVARVIGEGQKPVSETINGNRLNHRIRRKIAKHLGLSYERCWGDFDPREVKRESRRLRLAPAPEATNGNNTHDPAIN